MSTTVSDIIEAYKRGYEDGRREALTRAPQSQHVTLEYKADENILQHRDYPSYLDSPR